jgi:phage terminase large subunit GpA-like protein
MTPTESLAGRNAVREMWRESWRPPDRRPAWQWAEDNVKAIPYSPTPGGFRSVNSPWIRRPLEALTDVTIRKVQIVAGIQASKTLGSEIGSCHIVENMPGPMLWLDQKDEEASDELESRLKPLWRNTPAVKRLMPGYTGRNRYKSKRNKVTFLNGMTVWVLGAHNIKNLQRRSIRWLIGDETWSWPQGHMAEAEARVTAFGWLGKIFFSSQAGEESDDTDRSFVGGSQEEWNFKCLNSECEVLQPYLWANVEWSKEAKNDDGTYRHDEVHRTARILCPNCGHEHNTNELRVRRAMNDPERGADFVRMNPNAPADYLSFHWNGMASTPIGTLAVLYVTAKEAARKGDLSLLKIFYQKRLAIPWKDLYEDYKLEITRSTYLEGEPWAEECTILRSGAIVDHTPERPERDVYDSDEEFLLADRLYKRTVGDVPIRGRMMKVDCQRDHFWVTITSFSANGSTRLLWCGGGKEGERSIHLWEDIEDLQKKWEVAPHLTFVDAGYDTARVYLECAKNGWTALMGDQRNVFPHTVPLNPKRPNEGTRRVERFYSPARRVALGNGLVAKVHYYSNLNIKDILARLRRNQNPDEGVTYEVPDDVPEWFLKHMDSEQRIKKGNKWIWTQIGKRPNHALDCEAMGIAALVMMKLLGRDQIADGEGEGEVEGESEKS